MSNPNTPYLNYCLPQFALTCVAYCQGTTPYYILDPKQYSKQGLIDWSYAYEFKS